MKRKTFGIGPVKQRSMPFWPLQYQGTDPFGGPIMDPVDSLAATNLICWAGGRGLIELTSAHDDDLVPWNPENPKDDLDKKSHADGLIKAIRGNLDDAGVGFNMITCNLHGHPMFRHGGLTNPDPEIRKLAKLKVQRTLRIGSKLGAKRFTYWVARDGFEVPIVVPPEVLDWLADGLNAVTDYISQEGLDYEMATIESKPNEPRGHMYLPTAGHAVGFISILNEPDFWMVNPELPQHEGMTCLDPVTCVRFLVKVGKLGFLHFGNQINGQFDNDFPPLVGPEHLKETVEMFRVLDQLGWKGVVEFDCHALRCDLDPSDPIGCKKQFIRNCSTGLGIALALANRLKDFCATGLSDSKADLVATMDMCQLVPAVLQSFMIRR